LSFQKTLLEIERKRAEVAERAKAETERLSQEREKVALDKQRLRAERIKLAARREIEQQQLEQERLEADLARQKHEREKLDAEKVRRELELEKERGRLEAEQEKTEQLRKEQEEKRLLEEKRRIEQEKQRIAEQRREREEALVRLEKEKQELIEQRKKLEQERASEADTKLKNQWEELEQDLQETRDEIRRFDRKDETPPEQETKKSSRVPESDESLIVVEKAGLVLRFAAGMVDLALISGVVGLFLLVGNVVFSWTSPGAGAMGFGAFLLLTLPVYILEVLLAAGYFSYFHGSTGQTPGKMLLGLKVVDKTGSLPTYANSFLRFVAGTFSALLFFMGFIWIGLDLNKQGWHDKIAQTVVIRV
jgi:uncharacterized RDD family membrane protein YckC